MRRRASRWNVFISLPLAAVSVVALAFTARWLLPGRDPVSHDADDDAVAEADVLRPLARRREEGFGRGRVRVFLEEVMLDLPGMVIAQAVGELDRGHRVASVAEVDDKRVGGAAQPGCLLRAAWLRPIRPDGCPS